MRAFIAFTFLLSTSLLYAQKEFSALVELGAAKQSYLDGKFDQALTALDRLDKAAGAAVESLDLRGCIYMEQGKLDDAARSEERRVGKECRSRWSPYH